MSVKVYSQYLSSIKASIQGYALDRISEDVGVADLASTAKTIDDLAFIDSLLVSAGEKPHFFQSYEFLRTPYYGSEIERLKKTIKDEDLLIRVLDNLGGLVNEDFIITDSMVASSSLGVSDSQLESLGVFSASLTEQLTDEGDPEDEPYSPSSDDFPDDEYGFIEDDEEEFKDDIDGIEDDGEDDEDFPDDDVVDDGEEDEDFPDDDVVDDEEELEDEEFPDDDVVDDGENDESDEDGFRDDIDGIEDEEADEEDDSSRDYDYDFDEVSEEDDEFPDDDVVDDQDGDEEETFEDDIDGIDDDGEDEDSDFPEDDIDGIEDQDDEDADFVPSEEDLLWGSGFGGDEEDEFQDDIAGLDVDDDEENEDLDAESGRNSPLGGSNRGNVIQLPDSRNPFHDADVTSGSSKLPPVAEKHQKVANTIVDINDKLGRGLSRVLKFGKDVAKGMQVKEDD